LNDAVDVAAEVISTFLEFKRDANLERTSITWIARIFFI
jgi:hypothetical protein